MWKPQHNMAEDHTVSDNSAEIKFPTLTTLSYNYKYTLRLSKLINFHCLILLF